MAKPAAKKGDKIVAVDTHIVMLPSPGGPIPTPMPMPFNGALSDNLSPDGHRRPSLSLDPRRPCVQSNHAMKAHLVRMGNSRGIRLPKVVIEQAGLTEEVELEVRGATVVIAAARKPRAGWAEAARELHAAAGDRLLDPPTSTEFEETEWQW